MATCPTCKASFDEGLFCPRDGARLPEAFATGDILDDRYRLLRQVGSGAMGVVYEAEHLHMQRRVAVKVLRGDIAQEAVAVQRLQQEAQLTSDLGHVNIVQCRDFGHARDGRVYLVMEWLDGETLEALLERDGVDVEAAVEIAIQICSGLAVAHASHVIHRDLKPANLFIIGEGAKLRVKILDFGIAKLAERQSALTATGLVVGTPSYISPEQAIGDPVDGRTDIYALGAILYEMLVGIVPFRGESALAVLHQHSVRMPIAPSEAAPERSIPAALEAIVLRCLAKNPAERFASADELRLQLEHARDILDHKSAPVRVPRSREPTAPQPRTVQDDDSLERAHPYRRAPWLIAGIALAGLAALAIALVMATKSSQESTAARDAAIATAQPSIVDSGVLASASDAVKADASQRLITVVGVSTRATVTLEIPEVPIVGQPVQVAGTLTKLPPGMADAMVAGDLHVRLKLQYFHEDNVNLVDNVTHADRDGRFRFTVMFGHAAKHHAQIELSTDRGVVDVVNLQLYKSLIHDR